MAEADQRRENETAAVEETKDRGLFDLVGKKEEEKPKEEVIAGEFNEKVQVNEQEEKKPSLFEKLHRSTSSSSSSGEEEEGEGGEKRKKKKEKKKVEETGVHTEATPQQPEEKKGFLEKIKEKLPGQHKNAAGEDLTPPVTPAPATDAHEGEATEKKGVLEKIKEKLPGYLSKSEEEKDKDKESH